MKVGEDGGLQHASSTAVLSSLLVADLRRKKNKDYTFSWEEALQVKTVNVRRSTH